MAHPEQSHLLSEENQAYALSILDNLPAGAKRDLERPTWSENNEIGEIDYGWFEPNPFKRMIIRRQARNLKQKIL